MGWTSVFARTRSFGAPFGAVVVLVLVGCTAPEAPSCAETGICAADELCDRATGVCVAAPVRPDVTDVGAHLSVAVGPDGVVFVAARSEQPRALVVGRIEPGATEVDLEVVLAGARVAEGTSVAVGPAGQPRIAFFYAAQGAVRLASFNGTNWAVDVVDRGTPDEPRGMSPALAVTSAGEDVVAYRDAASGGVRVALRQGRGWAIQIVDVPEGGPGERGGRGFFTSLALAGSRPVIAHYDADAGDLRLLVPGASGWVVRVFGADPDLPEGGGPDWGAWATAAPDPLGNVGVAFHDATEGTLRVAWNQRGAIALEIADDGSADAQDVPHGVVGAFASLAFDRDGRPRIAYQDGARSALALAVRGPEGWTRELLDDEPISGHGVGLVVLPDGELVVVYRKLERVAGALVGRLAVIRR